MQVERRPRGHPDALNLVELGEHHRVERLGQRLERRLLRAGAEDRQAHGVLGARRGGLLGGDRDC